MPLAVNRHNFSRTPIHVLFSIAASSNNSIEPDMFLPIFAVIAAIVMTFAMPPSKDKQKYFAIPIGLGIAISVAMAVALQFRWERGGPFSGMANVFTTFDYLTRFTLLWSAITILVALVPEWRTWAKYVLPLPIVLAICFYALLFWA